eukprot:COSAG01_NODE_1281_length_10920_cov_39.473480_4_plen_104_part_00
MRCGRYTRGVAHHPVSGVMSAPGDVTPECAGCRLQAGFSCAARRSYPCARYHRHMYSKRALISVLWVSCEPSCVVYFFKKVRTVVVVATGAMELRLRELMLND